MKLGVSGVHTPQMRAPQYGGPALASSPRAVFNGNGAELQAGAF